METTTIPEESAGSALSTGGHPQESHHDLLVAGITILTFVSIFGTIGNVIVIHVILKERKLRMPGNYFIINLTVANIIITGFSIPVIVVNLIRELGVVDLVQYNLGVQDSGFCEASAYLKTIALHVAWYSLAFIALNRYYTVCRMNEYVNHFTKKHVLITIVLIWIWVLLINIPIMVGWAIPSNKELSGNTTGGYYAFYEVGRPPVLYDSSSHDCVLGVQNMGGYTYANGFFVLCIPLVAITFCYSLVYMAIVESRRKMKAAIDVKQLKRRYKKERKISIMLSTIVIVFILCWAPAIVYDYISGLDNHSEMDYVRLTFNWLALTNSAMNSILFAAMSKAFRTGYKRILIRILFKLVCGWCGCGRRMEQRLQNISLSTGSRTSSTRTPAKSRNSGVLMEFRKILRKSCAESQLPNATPERETPQRKSNPNFLEVPKENRHRKKHRYHANQYVCEVADPSNNELPSKNSSSDQKETEKENDVAENNKSSNANLILSVPTLGAKKKTFTPLLDIIGREQDVFSDGGIYLGISTHRAKLEGESQREKKNSSENKRSEKETNEIWVNQAALGRKNYTWSDSDSVEDESPNHEKHVGDAV